MGLTAVNRYVRMCRSNTTYQKIFSLRKSCLWVLFLWLFVACYIAIPQLAKLQDFEFVPGYAQCSIKHLGEQRKLIHYIVASTLFLVIPLVATAFSYSRVLKVVRQHLTGISPSLRGLGRNDARISIQEIRLSRSLFIVIFTFLACWVPLWFIVIMRRFSLVSHMPRNMELLCMFFLYVSIHSYMPEWILYSGASFAVSYFLGRCLCAHAHSDKMNNKNMNLAQWHLSNKVCYRQLVRQLKHLTMKLFYLIIEIHM